MPRRRFIKQLDMFQSSVQTVSNIIIRSCESKGYVMVYNIVCVIWSYCQKRILNFILRIYRTSNEVSGESILYREHLSQDANDDVDNSTKPSSPTPVSD